LSQTFHQFPPVSWSDQGALGHGAAEEVGFRLGQDGLGMLVLYDSSTTLKYMGRYMGHIWK
jgi:hypothetical protein